MCHRDISINRRTWLCNYITVLCAIFIRDCYLSLIKSAVILRGSFHFVLSIDLPSVSLLKIRWIGIFGCVGTSEWTWEKNSFGICRHQGQSYGPESALCRSTRDDDGDHSQSSEHAFSLFVVFNKYLSRLWFELLTQHLIFST